MKIHLSIPPIDECKNEDSCGMTCVRCNRCGRFNSEKMPLYCDCLLYTSDAADELHIV